MSDPAWALRTALDGHDGILYVQTAGTGTAPDADDELGFVTGFSFANEAQTTEKGAYLNLGRKKVTLSAYKASGSITVDVASGADTIRNLFFTAMTNKTRIKLTYQIDSATGEKHVMDQCIVGLQGETDPNSGVVYTFSFESDAYTHTAATA